MKKQTKLMLGDNIESLKKLPDNSIDSVVTDPPYGLGKERDMNIILKDWIEKGYSEIEGTGFMGKEWDAYVPQPQFWKEVYRVLKPGGHILAFFGTRTYDIGTMAIRMAGFEIRDQIMWLYGSGFPKSHNISKAIDKVEGNERKVIGRKIQRVDGTLRNVGANGSPFLKDGIEGSISKPTDGYIDIEEPGSDNSKMYEGWGTALKPANEPICLARKPLSEKSVAENVLKWGTGGINVDGCRVGNEGGTMKVDINKDSDTMFDGGRHNSGKVQELNEGRFPANLILECICDNREESDIHTNPMCPCRLLDEQSGMVSQGHWPVSKTTGFGEFGGGKNDYQGVGAKDKTKSGASRFFYQAKVSKSERNMGLDWFEDKEKIGNLSDVVSDSKNKVKNNHPTVKPINLMTYLCRLITPEGGIILDPFMGSGSTGISAQLEGFRFVGMEQDKSYFDIAEARINNYEKYKKFLK